MVFGWFIIILFMVSILRVRLIHIPSCILPHRVHSLATEVVRTHMEISSVIKCDSNYAGGLNNLCGGNIVAAIPLC